MPERDTNFAMRASCEIRHVELFKGIMQWRNGGMVEWWTILRRGLAEYPKRRNALLYVTKVSQKMESQ